MSDQRQDLEQLRARLRELGYLDRGIDRVLFGRTGALLGSRLARLGASLRIAAIAAALLAPPLALVASAANPLVRASARDPWLVALYLFAVLVPLLFAIELLGAGFAIALARWRGSHARAPEQMALRFGFLAGSLVFIYLGLSWARLGLADRILPGRALLAHAAALALALGVAASFGRLVTVAGLLALERITPRLPRLAPAKRWRTIAGLVLALAFFAGALLIFGARHAPTSEPVTARVAIRPIGHRVLVIGIDGLEREFLELRARAGDLPACAALLREGALAPVRLEQAQVPSLEWTTIATGRRPEDHNIQTLEVRRLPGVQAPLQPGVGLLGFDTLLGWFLPWVRETLRQPVDNTMLLQPPVWEILSQRGFWVGTVGWWATWPAASVRGFVISERAYHTLRAERPNRGDVYPQELFDQLAEVFPDDHRLDLGYRDLLRGAGRLREPLRAPLELDHYLLRIGVRLFLHRRPDFEALYLPGLDILRQRLLPQRAEAGLSDLEARLALLTEYVELLDAALGALRRHLDADTVLIVIGSPGRGRSSADGVLLAAGPELRRGVRLAPLTDLDLAPTLLMLMGLPASARMPGRARIELLEAAQRPRYPDPRRRIAGYGGRGRKPTVVPEGGAAMLEALRSLGYVQ